MQLGKTNVLRLARHTGVGGYLEDESGESLLLPKKWLPADAEPGDMLEVFVYLDNEERPIATTMKPKAQVGEFAYLCVKQVTEFGAFLDWGLEKDLFLPFREQQEKVRAGECYVVHVYLDEQSNRIAASTRLDHFSRKTAENLEPGQEIEVIITDQTELGYKVIANHTYQGLIYATEVFRDMHIGEQHKAYVKQIREDGKLDISLEKQGYAKVSGMSAEILQALKGAGGFLPLHDKSSPEAIRDQLGMSKKSFKQAIGALYKEKLIRITDDGVYLRAEGRGSRES